MLIFIMDPIEMEALVENYPLTREPSYLDKLAWRIRNLKNSARGYVVSLERKLTGDRIKYELN